MKPPIPLPYEEQSEFKRKSAVSDSFCVLALLSSLVLFLLAFCFNDLAERHEISSPAFRVGVLCVAIVFVLPFVKFFLIKEINLFGMIARCLLVVALMCWIAQAIMFWNVGRNY